MSKFTWDIEANGLLNNDTIDYLASPYRLKDTFQMHCIVLENHETGEIVAFHDGPKYIFDGRPYEESDGKYTYVLKEYVAQDYTHFQLKDFPDFINHEGYFKDKPEYLVEMAVAHNGINYDWLATKLFYGLDYSVKYNTWGKNKVKLIDSLILSKVLNPDRKIEGKSGHSLAALSRKAGGDVKIDFRKEIPEEDRFKTFAADMLYYCIYDNKANTSVYNYLMEEWGDYDKWEGPFELEQRVADIITRQEHRGFAFNMKQAEENLAFLDAEMERLRLLVEPILPPKPATKGYLKAFIPPKLQIKKNLEPTNHMINFAKKHDGHLEERDGDWWLVMLGKEWKLPVAADEPLCDPNIPATLNDTTHIKNWLVGLGWVPSEYKDKDLTLKSGTKIKKSEEELQKGIRAYVEQTLSSNFCQDRCDHLECTPETLERKIQERIAKGKGRGLKVLTNPCFTKGQEKEICPNLQALGEKFPYATQIVEYLTYKHRRNSILGGGADWEEDEEDQEYNKGFLAAVRADGRIPTPAATCDAACVVADTRIITDNGLQKIVDIAIGDLVLTHTGQYKPVVDKICNGIKEVFEVKDNRGLSLTCTGNHPFLTPSGWKRADELEEGEAVYTYQERETWSQVEGFSRYFISSWGRITTSYGNELETLRRTTLWSRADIDFIRDDGRKFRTGIGRMVLRAFVGEPEEGMECCHKDGNPCNNYVGNLYWGTSKQNSADASLHGRALQAGRNRVNAVLDEGKVNEIREYFLHNGYKRGDDSNLAKIYGCSRQLIGDIRRGRRWNVELNTENLYTEKFRESNIVSVKSVGLRPTYDVTIDVDHSYIADGFVTHNTSRMKHRSVANIPRVTSLFGWEMRNLFGVEVPKYFQIGYDFDSLEAKIESHYCVPMDAQALTRKGWVGYHDLKEGDEILGYNAETGLKEWTKVKGKVFYKNSKTFEIKGKSHTYRATADHRWYVNTRSKGNTYVPKVRTTAELCTGDNIICNAPFNMEQDQVNSLTSVQQGKWDVPWVERVVNMSHAERVAFLEGFLIADGYWHEHKQKPVWRWAQNPGELFEAALTASYLVHGGNISVAFNTKEQKVKVATLTNRSHIPVQSLTIEEWGVEDVWCPQTELGTWVMRQKDCITITGNCWRYEPEPHEYCNALLLEKPNDVHTMMAKRITDTIGRKFERSPAKSVKYGITYGAQADKVAKTIGSDKFTGQLVFDAFWEAAFPLARLKERLNDFWVKTGKQYVLGIDGRKVPTRSAHAILNSLFQSGGVICAKRAMVIYDDMIEEEGLSVDFFKDDWKNKDFVQQMIAYHDEAQLEVSRNLVEFKWFSPESLGWKKVDDPEEQKKIDKECLAKVEEWKHNKEKETGQIWANIHESPKGGWFTAYSRAGELAALAVTKAGEFYNLNVQLTAGYDVGNSWASCH